MKVLFFFILLSHRKNESFIDFFRIAQNLSKVGNNDFLHNFLQKNNYTILTIRCINHKFKQHKSAIYGAFSDCAEIYIV